jgi:Raf kinase inhibitor-like YbhB/YbcL family protein
MRTHKAQRLAERSLVGFWLCGLVACCGCQKSPPSASQPESSRTQPAGGKDMSFTMRSTAFEPNQHIPKKHTGEGEDLSPALSWSGAPDNTAEFALICDDPDAPRPEPWVHWVVYKIPASTTSLPEGVARSKTVDAVGGAMQGLNSWPSDNTGYRGPMPPPGHGLHHYHFKLYALDAALDTQPGLSKDELLQAMQGHVLAEAEMIGTYER